MADYVVTVDASIAAALASAVGDSAAVVKLLTAHLGDVVVSHEMAALEETQRVARKVAADEKLAWFAAAVESAKPKP